MYANTSILGNAYIRIRPDTTGFRSETRSNVGKALAGIGTLAKRAMLPLTVAVGAAGYFGVKTAAQLEQANIAFTNMLGSAKAAGAYLQQLQMFAAKTPFQFKDVVLAAQRLQAMGVKAQQVIPYLTAIGDAVSAMGGGAEQINQVVTAIGQMTAKGKIQSDEILQLTEAGIPALKILADSYGVTASQMSTMIQKGQVLSDKAVPALIKGLEQGTKSVRGFGGMMAQQSHTLTGLWSNFTDTLSIQLSGALKPFIPDIKRAVQQATPLVGQLLSSGAKGLQTAIKYGEQAVSDAKRVVGEVTDYFRPLTSRVEDFVKVLFSANGPLDDLWHGLQHVASAVGDVVQDLHPLVNLGGKVLDFFNHLPGPIQDAALALGALKVASAFGGFSKMAASKVGFVKSVGGMGQSVKTFGQTARVQFALADESIGTTRAAAGALAAGFEATMPRASASVAKFAASTKLAMAEVNSSFTQAKSLAQFNAGHTNLWRNLDTDAAKAKGNLAGLSAAAKTAGKVGFGALKAGATGLMGLLGGPWGLAITGATLGIGVLTTAIQKHDAAIKRDIQDVKNWNLATALDAGGDAGQKAAEKLDNLRQKIDTIKKQIASASSSMAAGPSRNNYLDGLNQKLKGLQSQLDKGTAAAKRNLDAMTPLQEAQQRADFALKDFNKALQNNPPNSHAVAVAAQHLADANSNLAAETDRANKAQKTQIQQLQDQASQALGAIQSGIAAQQAQQGLNDTIQQFNTDAIGGAASASQLSEEQTNIAQSALSAAQAAGQYAADQAKAKGVTDTTNAANQAQLKVLQDVAKQMGTATPTAILQAIGALKGATLYGNDLTGAVKKMGLTTVTESASFRKEFQGNATVLKDVTDGQIKNLQDLGYTVIHLPNHQILVSASTQAARDAISQLTRDYHNYSINLGIGGIGARYAAATGAILPGYTPGKDVHRFVSPTAGVTLDLSGGEGIARPEVVRAMGAGRFMALNAAAQRGGVGGVRKALAMASGGVLDMSLETRVGIDPAALAGARKALQEPAGRAMLALNWARTQVGKPYIWGGVGPDGYDCSGFMSALTNIIRGRRPYSRVGSTATFPWPGFAPGYGFFTIGSNPNAGGGIGHMAGTLLGVNVESTGDHVRIGAAARGASNPLFTERDHLLFDQGGWLRQGTTLTTNKTGKPEPVFTSDQWGVLKKLADGSGRPLEVHVHIGNEELTGFIDTRITRRDRRAAVNLRSSR